MTHLEKRWPRDLPQGVIHADLFPDNVFFLGDKLSGLIDFYFACTDMLAYDVAICLNAWCFEPDHSYNVTKGRACCSAYVKARPLSQAELEALPLLARGAALRFLLTRLVDWLERAAGRAGEAEGPASNISASCASIRRREASRLRPCGQEGQRVTEGPHVIIHTDGACSGNPGPGGWGAILTCGEHEKELKGGEAHTTNNRMELMAAIAALEALKRPCDGRAAHRQQVCARRHFELDPRLEEERLEDRRQEAGEECRSVAAARCRGPATRRALALGQGPCRP